MDTRCRELARTLAFEDFYTMSAASYARSRHSERTEFVTATISSEVKGTNGLTKAGAGVLSLTGLNTYTGTTVLNQGTLAFNSNAAFGAAAGGLSFGGGTLQWTAGNTADISARAVTIGLGGASSTPMALTEPRNASVGMRWPSHEKRAARSRGRANSTA